MGGVLFIHGGDEHARSVYERDGRAYWSQALPLVLEKHGYLDVRVAGPEALVRLDVLREADCILVAGLPEEVWTSDAVAGLEASGRPALVEGPLPPRLDEHLGVESEPSDGSDGAIVVADAAVHAAASRFGVGVGGRLTGLLCSSIERDSDLDWSAVDTVPLDAAQAAAWGAPCWDRAAWRVGADAAVIAEWVRTAPPHDRQPAIVRRGDLFGCAFTLFGFVAQRLSTEPFPAGTWLTSHPTSGLEALLVGVVDDMYRRAGAVRARVLPWPPGIRWVRVLQHEVVDSADAERAPELLVDHARAGTGATWYWTPSSARETVAGVARDPRHEIALSAELLWAGDGNERATVERHAARPVVGVDARASSSCFRYQGAPNPLWAERERMNHVQTHGRPEPHPHRFPALRPDGTVRPLDVICLPTYETVPAEGVDGERLRASEVRARASRGLLVLRVPVRGGTRHGLAALASMPARDRADWTGAQVAAWWRRTHTAGGLTLRSLGAGSFELTAGGEPLDVVVELLRPDGSAIDIPVTVEAPSTAVFTPRRAAASVPSRGGPRPARAAPTAASAELWDSAVTPLLRAELWAPDAAYFATHYLMIPLYAAFELEAPRWRAQFAEFVGRWAAAEQAGNFCLRNPLTRLQFLFLLSRFAALAASARRPELIPARLVRVLHEEFAMAWEPHARDVRRKLASTERTWTNAITDSPLYVMAIGADLVTLQSAGLEHAAAPFLADVLRLGGELLTAGAEVAEDGAWLLQPGYWWDHAEYVHAGHAEPAPGLEERPVPGLACDVSHSHRFPVWLESLTSAAGPDSLERGLFEERSRGLERQFVDHVLVAPTHEFPSYRTNNFMDGRNGVYRLGFYTLGAGNGYGPYQLSGTLLLGWWSRLPGERIRAVYADLAQRFPLPEHVRATYLGPRSSLVRAPGLEDETTYRSGLRELIVRLAAEMPSP